MSRVVTQDAVGALRPLPSRWRYAVAVAAVALLAAGLRLPNVTAAYPYTAYIDEGNYLWPAITLYGRGGWDPDWYLYPSLPLYAACAAARVADVGRGILGLPLLRVHASQGFTGHYDPLEPPGFLLAARSACFGASLVLVVWAGLLARRWGGPAAGIVGGLLAAVTPALVVRGGIATIDVWSAMFVGACLLAADGLYAQRKGSLAAGVAGFLAGCAAASKYTAVLVAATPAAAILLRWENWSSAARRLAALGAGISAGLFIAMPAVWLHPARVWDAVLEQGHYYSTLPWKHGYLYQAVVRMEEDLPFEVAELGWLFVVLLVSGLAIALKEEKLRTRLVGFFLFAALSLCLHASFDYRPFRGLLPLVAPAAALAALPIARALRARRSGVWATAALVLFLVVLVPPAVVVAKGRASLVDPRVEARRWLERRARPSDHILVLRELRFLPDELARVPGRVEVVGRQEAIASVALRPPRLLLVGSAPPEGEENPNGWSDVERTYRRRAAFGTDPPKAIGWWWLANKIRIEVLVRRPTGSAG